VIKLQSDKISQTPNGVQLRSPCGSPPQVEL